MTPLVSVVIPTYNQPTLLLETLESVKAQTFSDFEIVVINDGSTDDTLERLLAWSRSEPRLRVVSQSNAGIGAARNRGIDEARGKYVALLDHDDLWRPRKLETQVSFMERNPDCIAASTPYSLSTSPDVSFFDVAAFRDSWGIVPRPLRRMADSTFVTTSAVMVHRERAQGLRYGTVRDCIEDIEFYIGLFCRGPFGIAGDDILTIYRQHGDNFSKRASYFYHGMRRLRRLIRQGDLGPLTTQEREDLEAYFNVLSKGAAMRQLFAGHRWRGLTLWAQEAPHQLGRGHFKFVALYPLVALLPVALLLRKRAG